MAAPALIPAYETSKPNEPVSVYVGPVELEVDSKTIQARGTVRCSWLPTPRIEFEAHFEERVEPGPITLTISERGISTTGFVVSLETRYGESGEPEVTMIGLLDSTDIESGRLMTSVLFHVANFVRFDGSAIELDKGGVSTHWNGRVSFKAGPWSVTLDGVSDLSSLVKLLDKGGGFAITHVGKLERTDGSEFNRAMADDALQMLSHLFSFAAGRKVSVALPIGFDSSQERVWEQWRHWIAQSWVPVKKWFPSSDPFVLKSLAPGFQRRWSAGDWQQVLVLAVSWFCEANSHAVVQPAIVSEQVGLELLAWAVLVQEGNRLSSRGFGRLEAHDQIRLLVTLMKAPTRPTQPVLTTLQTYADQKNVDGPGALSQIRNRIVHPPKGTGGGPLDPRLLYEAKELGLWYLELAVLWFVGFSGNHLNRTVPRGAGESPEPVPWV